MMTVKRYVLFWLWIGLLAGGLASGSVLAAEATGDQAGAENLPAESDPSGGVRDEKVPEQQSDEEKKSKPGEVSPAGGVATKPTSGPEAEETVEVKRTEVEILVEAEGILGSVEGHVIRVNTDRWTDLRVVEAVPHGSVVTREKLLVRFETWRIEEVIADLEREIPAKEEALSLARGELKRLRATQAGDLARARRICEETKVDYDYYLATARPQKLKEAAQGMKRTSEFLEYEKEELRQLLMMYEADDLTEETEEIILKRQRNKVENAGNSLQRAKIAHDLIVGTTVPRQDKEKELKWKRAGVELALAEVAIPNARKAKQLEVTSAEHALARKKKILAELRSDLKVLRGIHAPVDGVVLHGAVESGKATTASRVKTKLQPRGKVTPDEVLMTMIGQRPAVVHLKLKEKDLSRLQEGMAGVAKLEGAAGGHLGVKLVRLGLAPGAEGEYSGIAEITDKDLPVSVRPGRSAKVVFQVYYEEDGLVLPAKVVHERIRDGRLEEVVYLPGGEGEHAMARVVQTGPLDAERVTILSGLEEGMKVLVKKP